MFGQNLRGACMWCGGMIISNPLFLFICVPLIVMVITLGLAMEPFRNLLFYGTIFGPCVSPSGYEDMGYGSREDLIYDEELQCYLQPELEIKD